MIRFCSVVALEIVSISLVANAFFLACKGHVYAGVGLALLARPFWIIARKVEES